MAEILSGQERIFQSRRASLEGRVDVTRQRIAQYRGADQGIPGPVHRRAASSLTLIREELVDVHGTDGERAGT